jgi:hypothetical protein
MTAASQNVARSGSLDIPVVRTPIFGAARDDQSLRTTMKRGVITTSACEKTAMIVDLLCPNPHARRSRGLNDSSARAQSMRVK